MSIGEVLAEVLKSLDLFGLEKAKRERMHDEKTFKDFEAIQFYNVYLRLSSDVTGAAEYKSSEISSAEDAAKFISSTEHRFLNEKLAGSFMELGEAISSLIEFLPRVSLPKFGQSVSVTSDFIYTFNDENSDRQPHDTERAAEELSKNMSTAICLCDSVKSKYVFFRELVRSELSL